MILSLGFDVALQIERYIVLLCPLAAHVHVHKFPASKRVSVHVCILNSIKNA